LISTSEAKVDIPTTFKVSEILVISSSVLPSTSRSPLASIAALNVVTPATDKLLFNVT